MVDESLLRKIRKGIIRAAKDEQELDEIVQLLTETDWREAYYLDKENRIGKCSWCYKRFPYHRLIKVNPRQLACASCYVSCPSCGELHVRPRAYWLYPLCEKCVDLVDRKKVEREYVKLYSNLQRARKNNVPATLTLGEWIGTLIHFSWKCAYCQSNNYEHCDHFLPIKHGGGTTRSNCVPACKECNFLKSQYHPSKVTNLPRENIVRVQNYLSQYL
jgi:hypothetical protein